MNRLRRLCPETFGILPPCVVCGFVGSDHSTDSATKGHKADHKQFPDSFCAFCAFLRLNVLLLLAFSARDFNLFDDAFCEHGCGEVAVKRAHLSGCENNSIATVDDLVREVICEERTINLDDDVSNIPLAYAVDDRQLPGLKLR